MTAISDVISSPTPLPPDPVAPMPDEVARETERYRAGDVDGAREGLRALAASGRTAKAGAAAAALAGIELVESGPGEKTFLKALAQVAGGEDPWLGPLAACLPSMELYAALDSLSPDDPLAASPVLRGVSAHLTGDQGTARTALAEAVSQATPGRLEDDLSHVLLGHHLLYSGAARDEVEEPLTHVLASDDAVFTGYARYLLGHLLTGHDEPDRAGEMLTQALSDAHPTVRQDDSLLPWAGVRLGELLAGHFELDCVVEQMERSGVAEMSCVREPFESGAFFTGVSRPALAGIGLGLFTGDMGAVRAGLQRLREWSDERHERGRALCLVLGHRLLADEPDAGRERTLKGLLDELKQC
ncbi:hypothetical protein ACF06W_28515 [Streptomyces albus]|uniref:hypothetical protein n=1 Tax=Streptomyces albus TaxID=1888 RepID=UPI003703203D